MTHGQKNIKLWEVFVILASFRLHKEIYTAYIYMI